MFCKGYFTSVHETWNLSIYFLLYFLSLRSMQLLQSIFLLYKNFATASEYSILFCSEEIFAIKQLKQKWWKGLCTFVRIILTEITMLKGILVAVKNTDDRIFKPSEIFESDERHLFSNSDGIWIDDNKYLENLETTTESTILTTQKMHNLSTYFDLKIYLEFRNISCTLKIDYFIWQSKTVAFCLAASSKLQLFTNKQTW